MADNVHTRTQEAFSSYVEGDLGEDERRKIDEHLAGCIQCRTHLERFRGTIGKLGALKERAPSAFLAGVQDQIRTRSQGRFFGRRRLLFGRIPFEWLSLGMIVAMLVYYIITQHAAPTHVTPSP